MAEKITFEMEGRSEKLENKLRDLHKELQEIDKDSNYSDSLEQNIRAYSDTISKVEELRRVIVNTSKEISKMKIEVPAGGTNRSRQSLQDQFSSLQDFASSASTAAVNSRSKTANHTRSSVAGSPRRYYEPKLNEPAIMGVQREDASYRIKEQNTLYSNLRRDASDANKSVMRSQTRLKTSIQAGNFITPAEQIMAKNNIEKQRGILTDNGRYSDNNGRINNLKSELSQNNAIRSSIIAEQKSITNNGQLKASQLPTEQRSRLEELNSQGDLLKRQNQSITEYIKVLDKAKNNLSNLEKTMSNPDAKFAPTGGLSGLLYSRSQKIANGAVYGGFGSLAGLGLKGNSIIDQNQPLTRAIGANNGTYDSRAVQLSAQRSGMRYGLTGSDMLGSEMAYMDGRGYTNQSDMNQAGINTGMFAKTTGMTIDQSNQLTSVISSNTNDKGSSGLKDVQDTFYGALKQAGLTNRAYGQSSQLSNILGTYTSLRGGQATTAQLQGQTAMQSALGSTGNSGLLGANGANFMNQMNTSIIGQGANSPLMQLALMKSDPSKFNGSYNGYANIIDQTSKGLDGTNLKAITGMSDMMGPRANSYFSNMLKGMGVNVTPDTASDILKLSKSGKLDGLDNKDMIAQLQKSGAISSDDAKKMQQGSQDASYDKGQASFEKASTTVGNLTRNITALALRATGGSAAILALGTAAAGAAISLGKIGLATSLSGGIKNSVGGSGISGTGGKGGGFLSRVGTATKEKIGGLSSAVSNSSIGQAVGATTLFQKGKGIVSGASSKGAGLLSKGTGLLSKVGTLGEGVVGKALPWVGAGLTAVDTVSNIANGASAKQIGSGIGSGGGAILGGVLGSALGPLGTIGGSMLGSWLGGAAGSGIGGLFGSDGSKQKDDESLTNKKLSAEQMRTKNIKDDETFVNKYGKVVDKKSDAFSGGGSNNASSDSSTSPFDNIKNTGGKGAAGSTDSGVTKVIVTGEIKHSGDVTDMSQVQVSAEGVLSNLFNNVQANETRRV